MGTPTTGFSTNTFAIDNGQRYKVIAQTYCYRIMVQENYNSVSAPTCDLLAAQPAGATQVNIAKGTPVIFTRALSDSKFMPGQVVGDIETVTGSCTVQQIESQQI